MPKALKNFAKNGRTYTVGETVKITDATALAELRERGLIPEKATRKKDDEDGSVSTD